MSRPGRHARRLPWALTMLLCGTGCRAGCREPAATDASTQRRATAPANGLAQAQARLMVRRQIVARGVSDPRVLAAMRKVPRHRFVPADRRDDAYDDRPLGIGHQQTISQPYIVAYMSEALRLAPNHRVLEIGTGSGYQAAVLAELAREVYSIEIVPALGRRAARILRELGYRNVQTRIGDGYRGWAEQAPFDAIMLTAAPPRIPPPLLAQLRVGGVLVAPVGKDSQELVRVTRSARGYVHERLLGVRFVPMTGQAQDQRY